jgi:protein ThiW
MKNTNIQKLSIAGILCALAVVGSLFSFPVLGSKCAPIQHMVNIVCAVLLGPWYGVAVAFAASLLRNVLGLGSLMAFPGSMFGALLCGLVYDKSKNIIPTLLAEVFGTAVLGGLCAYPIAIFIMGKSSADIAFYAYIIPFLISTAAGAIMSAVLLYALTGMGALAQFKLWVDK